MNPKIELLITSFMERFKVSREQAEAVIAALFDAEGNLIKLAFREPEPEPEVRMIPHAEADAPRSDIDAMLKEMGMYLSARAPDGWHFALLIFDGVGGQMFISDAPAAEVSPQMAAMAKRLRESHN